jgi:hypothetical protein
MLLLMVELLQQLGLPLLVSGLAAVTVAASAGVSANCADVAASLSVVADCGFAVVGF